MRTLDKIVKGSLILILIIAIILVVYLVVIHNPGEAYTEFYIVDHNNNTTAYPTNITQNSIQKVYIGTINQEHEKMNYTVIVSKDKHTLRKFNFTIKDKESHEIPYYMTSSQNLGENQEIDFTLYKGNLSQPYRKLNIKYNVI